MTSEEIKQAMKYGTAVMCNGMEYKRITAYIYRSDKDNHTGKIKCRLQCEVLDKCGISVSIVNADKITRIA